ncbi:hypothetical protein M8C13_01640 [Crossiella sp. SN42]|uniref:hypothetical protein n=1 Tax=Crossiella sp. SN42 TaxID=2944808 RepID=UPI00207D1774|nr:hypothetical protein [Crossiella sp. SN42]MCO1574459.1 hypothetical protein [Crossiella sp. SN42]
MLSGEAELWSTVDTPRAVLIVVRNLTSLVRLLDVIPALASDKRLTFRFTLDVGSAFTAGLRQQLDRFNITLHNWDEVVGLKFDLVLAAHVNPSLAALKGRLVVVPHGVGYNRRLPRRTKELNAPVGLSRRELSTEDGVFPAAIGLSHERQYRHLRRCLPAAADRAEVIGDPTWDRIRASTTRRAAYRRALGVRPDQRLILVSSTWGRNSLLGRQQDVAEQLLAQLPLDEYRVALVLHPNIWDFHGVTTVLTWFRDALDSGLLLIRPEDSWQAAVVAADIGVGDHGSVAFYTAALGCPFLTVSRGFEDLTASSVTRQLMRRAPRLQMSEPLRSQIDEASPLAALTEITARALGHEGKSMTLLRQLFYRLLQLPAPAQPPRTSAFTAPQPLRGNTITAFHVHARRHDCNTVLVERFPAILEHFRCGNSHADHRLVVLDEEIDDQLRDNATIIIQTGSLPAEDVDQWVRHTLENTKAELVATTTGDRCELTFHESRQRTIRPTRCAPEATSMLVAAVMAYHLVTSDELPRPGEKFTARLTGHPEVEVRVEQDRQSLPAPEIEAAGQLAQARA